MGHDLGHGGLLHEIIESRMKGKPTTGRRRMQMLHTMANDGGYVALNGQLRTERDGDSEKLRMSKPAIQQKITAWWMYRHEGEAVERGA